MSSGGGIARFASRKIDTNNPGTTAGSAKNGNDQTTATPAPNSLPFATNDNHDTVSTASDDEFGFLNGGNSFGGDDFGFLSDGGFDEETLVDGTEENNQRGRVQPTPGQENKFAANQHSGSGISLFQKRIPESSAFNTEGIAPKNTSTVSQDNALKNEAPQSIVQFSSSDFATYKQGSPSQSSETFNDASAKVIVPQPTNDGRILPVPILPTIGTHTTAHEEPVQQINNNDSANPAAEKNFNLTGPSLSHESTFSPTAMAPPPPKRPSTVTPMSDNTPNVRFSIDVQDPEGKQLFQTQQRTAPHDEENFLPSVGNVDSNIQTLNGSTSQLAIDAIEILDANEVNDAVHFNDGHQQFLSTMQVLLDQDVHYQDLLLEGTIKLNVATSILLQLKCDMYDLTDHILDELDSVQEFIQNDLPVVE